MGPNRRLTRGLVLTCLALGFVGLLWPQAARKRATKKKKPRAQAVLQSVSWPVSTIPYAPPQSLPPPSEALCPTGMVLVDGMYCPEVAFRCLKHLGEGRLRCAEFARTRRCYGKPEKKRFCVDRYEYPNQPGAKPNLAMTWEEAKRLCQAQSKRLCMASEWTLACEGPDPLPYPYGFTRDATLCNVDKPYRFPNDFAFANRATRAQEIARLDQREPSGSRAGCVSPYGVYDLTGNVDEWVHNEKGARAKAPYVSGLKGGYWGPVRNRCRPITDVHNMWHWGYQIGLRCCADAPPEVQPRCGPKSRRPGGSECRAPAEAPTTTGTQ